MPFSTELSQAVRSFLDAHADGTACESSMPLMIMLVIVREGAPIEFNKLAMELMKTFPAFNRKVLADASSLSDLKYIVNPKLLDTLRSYDFEFFRIDAGQKRGKIEYGITERGALFILRQLDPHPAELTPPPPDKICHLMNLPPELRVRIFEFVLHLPNSGVMVKKEYPYNPTSERIIQMVSRDPAPRRTYREWASFYLDDPRHYGRPPIGDAWLSFRLHFTPLLNLLAVSKTFKAIGEQIFYSKNLFRAWNLHEWGALIAGLAPSRAALLRCISFYWSTHDVNCAADVLGKLKGLGVTSISLRVNKKDWKGTEEGPYGTRLVKPVYHFFYGPTAPPSTHPALTSPITFVATPAELPGMAELCSFGETAEILVEGDWKEFADYVRQNSKVKKVTFNGATVDET